MERSTLAVLLGVLIIICGVTGGLLVIRNGPSPLGVGLLAAMFVLAVGAGVAVSNSR